MTIQYNLVNLGDQENLTAFIGGVMYVATQDHPNWDAIVTGIRAGDESVTSLFDPQKTINEKFDRLTDRVSLRGGKVYFDNEVTDSTLATQIVRFYNDGEDFMPLVNFMEKVAMNPQEDSQKHLYEFIRSRDEFTITPDGDLLAYKGVHPSDRDDYEYRSGSQGHAIVDGEEQNGYIHQNVGSVVEMPRSEVTHDPNQSCAAGLHVGTHSYAKGYGTILVRVLVHPRDFVSVPHYEGEKARVCRYVVLEEESSKIETPVYEVKPWSEPMVDDTEDDEDFYCYNCGFNTDHETVDCPVEDEDDDDEYGYTGYGY